MTVNPNKLKNYVDIVYQNAMLFNGIFRLFEFKLVYSSPMIAGQGLSYTRTITVDASADARLRAAAHTPAGIFFFVVHAWIPQYYF